MNKVKITADGVLELLKELLSSKSVNPIIAEENAPKEWRGKTLFDAVNAEYYTFKNRPVPTAEIIKEKLESGEIVSTLYGLNRSFCLVSLDEAERLFSKDVDMLSISATMEYWIQTSKIKLLEELVERVSIDTNGVRVEVKIGAETRKAVVIFQKPYVTDIDTETACGEMATCEVGVSLLFYPDAVSYCDYEVKFCFLDDMGKTVTSEPIPLSSFSFVQVMTQKAVPQARNIAKVGNINLSCANSFVLVFDGYNNEFINFITDKALSNTALNNGLISMILTRKGKPYEYDVVVKDHQIMVNADTGNETHTLSLVTKGVSLNVHE